MEPSEYLSPSHTPNLPKPNRPPGQKFFVMSGWCGSCVPGGSAFATAGLKMIAAAAVIPTARRHITLKFIPYTPLDSALRDLHLGDAAAAVATAADALNRHCRAVAIPRTLAQFISGSSLQVFDAYEL
jgi:hypothetical protein